MTSVVSNRKACVIGWPISHSRSPVIHGAWLKRYGVDGTYQKIAVPPDELAAFFGRLADDGFAGCNVTIPHKEAVFSLAHHREPSAIAIGAANTVWLDGGKICVSNTDVYGFMTHLAVSAPDWNKRPGAVCVIGAGGAARGVIYGLLEAGATDVRVFNRTLDRAGNLIKSFDRQRVRACAWSDLTADLGDATVIINTTSLGMNGKGCPPVDFTGLDPATIVVDIVYVPLETEFLRRARLAGLVTVDGLGMLLHQAVPGFEKWFGIRPEVTSELRRLVVADIEAH